MSKNIDIEQLIMLSALNVSDEEKKGYQKEIDEFLTYAEIINKADCDDLTPSAHPIEKKAIEREDNSRTWERLEELFNCGPIREGNAYLVPPQKGRKGSEEEISEENRHVEVSGDEYETVIGLEVHAHLKTKSKLFCSCSTEFGKDPNENTCPVCSGHPGVLPVLNKNAVRMAILAGHAMHCKVNTKSVFARKNYFYPDLPKGYQISQFEEPICSGGYIEIDVDGEVRKVQLNRIHMEEDAGKMVHVGAPGIWGSKASAVDFNRSSVPLIEIVTEPDLNSAREAKEYVMTLRAILTSLGICDGNLEEGSLRCDANISIRPKGDKKLGVKTEVKNMNSFKAIERAIDFEIKRQIKLKKLNLPIDQETRLWDENSQKTYTMRSKEESHDYRYFPDPDLLPLILEQSYIDKLKEEIPLSPIEKKNKYMNNFNLRDVEAQVLIQNPGHAEFYDKLVELYNNYKNLANWFFNELLMFTDDFKDIHLKPEVFVDFLKRIDAEEISGKIGKQVLKKSFETKKDPLEIIESEGLKQISDPKKIEELIDNILSQNKSQLEAYKGGKTQLFGFFVGQVMKASGGKVNPKIANEILKKKMDS